MTNPDLPLRPARHLPSATTRQRIGLFGGSFDPPHPGHLHVARTARKHLGLDQVWWVPARGNPLKPKASPFDTRLVDLRKLVAGDPAMRVSDIEHQAQLTYTVDLVSLWQRHCRQADLVWIMGGDSLASFHRWHRWRALAAKIPIAIVSRPGTSMQALNSRFARTFAPYRWPQVQARAIVTRPAPAWTYISAPFDDTSSTALRALAET